jgi:hypothetical protein
MRLAGDAADGNVGDAVRVCRRSMDAAAGRVGRIGASRAQGGRFRRTVGDCWRVLPGDLIGAGAARLSGARASRTLDVLGDDGAVRCRAVLVEDARLDRWLDLMPMRPVAMTFGRFVLARRPLPGSTVRHELEHVRQWSRLGPLFLPAYLVESMLVRARGGDRYRGNRFEIAARAREAPVREAPTGEGRAREAPPTSEAAPRAASAAPGAGEG